MSKLSFTSFCLSGLALASAGLASAGLVSASLAQTPAAKPKPNDSQCFYSNQYQGFRPIDDRAFYIRVNVNDFYRIDLADTCPALLYPDPKLITVVRGSDLICNALDWDLRVGENGPGGFATPCIVKSQTKLTPAQALAIPPKQKP